MSGNFRYTRWDPILISSQIVAIQSTYYTTLGLLFYIFANLTGHLASLDQIFSVNILSFRTTVGWLIIFTFLVNSVTG